MNPTTPEQARQLAKQLSEIVYREDEHHTLLWNCCEQSAGYLRSLSDQVEALTAELNNIASANLKTWDKDYNTAADFMAWAQSRARAAIAKGTA